MHLRTKTGEHLSHVGTGSAPEASTQRRKLYSESIPEVNNRSFNHISQCRSTRNMKKTRQHGSCKSQQFHGNEYNDGEIDVISQKEFKK
jgi:hypothetical protein